MENEILGSREPYPRTYYSLQPTTGDAFDENGKLKAKPFYPPLPDPKTITGSWAMVITDIYPITKRGNIHSGKLLYGKPGRGDEVLYHGIKDKVTVTGVDRFSVSFWYGAGMDVGILLDREEPLPVGTCLIGYKTKDSIEEY